MNILKVIEAINKDYKTNINTEMYSKIASWRQWYQGHVDGFHKYSETINKKKTQRERYGLKMASKVCQDWAGILCNNKSEIILEHKESNDFINGVNEQSGVLGGDVFWTQVNQLTEKSFALGTGATDIYFENMRVTDEGSVLKDIGIKPKITYILADSIIPLSWENGNITEVAFASDVVDNGKPYVYVRMHRLTKAGYEITNSYYKGEQGQALQEVPLPEGMIKSFNTGNFIKLFSIWKPNKVNTVDLDSPLGASIYSDSIDTLKAIDVTYDNLYQDFFLGGKMVFIDGSLYNEKNAPPAYSRESMFRVVGNALDEGKGAYYEYNPTLRVQENTDGIQAQLDYLSMMVGFGTKHYKFNLEQFGTATEYTGSKQDLVQNAEKHSMMVERALTDIIRAMLWIGRELMGLAVKEDARITFIPDQSYIIDEETERQFDLQLVRDGIMAKWEWRMKYYGEDEATAKVIINNIEGNEPEFFEGED